jgi:hypothetical protein
MAFIILLRHGEAGAQSDADARGPTAFVRGCDGQDCATWNCVYLPMSPIMFMLMR